MISIKRILYLFAIAALLAMSPGGGADHVDFPDIYIDGTTGGVGSEADPLSAFSDINWTTGGDNSVYDAVAAGKDVTINLKRGVTWREQLTVGASGSAAHPITIQAYGEGAKPIINGAVIYDSWTGEGEVVVLDKASTAGSNKIFNTALRAIGGQGAWSCDGDYVVTALETGFSYEYGTFSQNCVAEIYTMSGDNLGDVVDTSDAQLVDGAGTYKFIGMNASLSNGVSYALVVRRADSSYDDTDYLKIYFDNSGNSWSGAYCEYQADGTRINTYATYEASIKLYAGGVSPYYADYTTSPRNIFWDGVRLTENVTSKESLDTGEWWNDTENDRIYVYDNPSGHVVEGSYYNKCIYINGKSYITIEDLEVRRSNWTNIFIDITNGLSNNIIVQNCTVRESYNQGIRAGASSFGDTGHGVASGISILDNTCIDNGIGATTIGDGTGVAVNISGAGPDDYIEDVLVQGNTSDGDAYGFKGDWFSNDVTFKGNYAECIGAPFAVDGGQDITFEYNIADGTNTDHSTYAFPMFRWEGAPGPPYGFALDNIKILNNVMYGYKKGVSLADDNEDVLVKNNIFYSDFADNVPVWMEGGETRTRLDIDNNCYYTGANSCVFTISGVDTYTFAQWQAEGYDASAVNSDPLMADPGNDDFTLQVGSPCINRGTFVGLILDYLGLPVPIGHRPDIGAYEHKNGGAVIH